MKLPIAFLHTNANLNTSFTLVLGPSPLEPNNEYPNAIMTYFAKNPTAHPVFVSHACSRIKKKNTQKKCCTYR